jgi:hypothetical protein
MTKEQLYVIWALLPELKADIEAVIAYEIEKAKGEAKPEAEQVTEPAKPKFDQDRFERVFCALLVGDVYVNALKGTEDVLKQLDAYYATKKGGNNE